MVGNGMEKDCYPPLIKSNLYQSSYTTQIFIVYLALIDGIFLVAIKHTNLYALHCLFMFSLEKLIKNASIQ
jgi:hypothetical protein